MTGEREGICLQLYRSITCFVCKPEHFEILGYGGACTRLQSNLLKNIYLSHDFCTMEVHQHGVLILGSENFCKTFQQISEVWGNTQG